VEGSGVVDAASVGVDSDSVVVTSALVGMIEDLLSGSAVVASEVTVDVLCMVVELSRNSEAVVAVALVGAWVVSGCVDARLLLEEISVVEAAAVDVDSENEVVAGSALDDVLSGCSVVVMTALVDVDGSSVASCVDALVEVMVSVSVACVSVDVLVLVWEVVDVKVVESVCVELASRVVLLLVDELFVVDVVAGTTDDVEVPCSDVVALVAGVEVQVPVADLGQVAVSVLVVEDAPVVAPPDSSFRKVDTAKSSGTSVSHATVSRHQYWLSCECGQIP